MIELIAAVAVGGALEAYGANKAARARARALSDAADETKKAYDSAAADTLQAAEFEVFKSRLQGANVLGEARVIQGASRLDDGEDALRKTAYMVETEVAITRMNARRAAWGLKLQGLNAYRSGKAAAAAAREEGRAALYRTLIGTGTALAAYGTKYGGGGQARDLGAKGDPTSAGFARGASEYGINMP